MNAHHYGSYMIENKGSSAAAGDRTHLGWIVSNIYKALMGLTNGSLQYTNRINNTRAHKLTIQVIQKGNQPCFYMRNGSIHDTKPIWDNTYVLINEIFIFSNKKTTTPFCEIDSKSEKIFCSRLIKLVFSINVTTTTTTYP